MSAGEKRVVGKKVQQQHSAWRHIQASEVNSLEEEMEDGRKWRKSQTRREVA